MQILVNGHGIAESVVILFSLPQVAIFKLFRDKTGIFLNALAPLYSIVDDTYMSKSN